MEAVGGMGVRIEREGSVALVLIDRPARRNALDAETRRRLLRALESAFHDHAIGAVVLTGAGGAFCAGSDLDGLALSDSTSVLRNEYTPIIRAIRSTGKPVLAAVDGAAAGAGVGLALACDLVLASSSASFDMAFIRLALMPDVGVAWHLVRAVGRWRAAELLWTGARLTAVEAHELGLDTSVVHADSAIDEARRRAQALADGPRSAIAASKSVLAAAAVEDLWTSMDREAVGQGGLRASDDHIKALDRALARRRDRTHAPD
jgi:2-(1,2-epoxy-1,2-dihydrophenyl)acetyl-CoA isomerase